MNIDVAIVDDSSEDIQSIEQSVKRFMSAGFSLAFHEYTNSEDPKIFLEKAALYLLDIDMPKMDGIALAQYILKTNPKARIVFVSKREDLVFETFKVNALYFVRKRTLDEDMNDAIGKISKYLLMSGREFVIHSNSMTKKIPNQDILYFEVTRNTMNIHTVNALYKIRCTMKKVIEQLDASCFIRPHSSFLVNTENILEIDKDEIILCNGERIKIASRNRTKVMEEYQRYLLQL